MIIRINIIIMMKIKKKRVCTLLFQAGLSHMATDVVNSTLGLCNIITIIMIMIIIIITTITKMIMIMSFHV